MKKGSEKSPIDMILTQNPVVQYSSPHLHRQAGGVLRQQDLLYLYNTALHSNVMEIVWTCTS